MSRDFYNIYKMVIEIELVEFGISNSQVKNYILKRGLSNSKTRSQSKYANV